MAIRKKPERTQEPLSPKMEQALAFVQKASVNQSVEEQKAEQEAEEGTDRKKAMMLRLWESELARIDWAVAAEAAQHPYSKRRVNRHQWIVDAIFEKVARVEQSNKEHNAS